MADRKVKWQEHINVNDRFDVMVAVKQKTPNCFTEMKDKISYINEKYRNYYLLACFKDNIKDFYPNEDMAAMLTLFGVPTNTAKDNVNKNEIYQNERNMLYITLPEKYNKLKKINKVTEKDGKEKIVGAKFNIEYQDNGDILLKYSEDNPEMFNNVLLNSTI